MSIYSQQLRKLGGFLAFKRDTITVADSPVLSPWVDLGVATENPTPGVDRGVETVYDPRYGRTVPVYQEETKAEHKFTAKVKNTNPWLMSLYLNSAPPAASGQTADAVTNILHKAWPGTFVQITDAAGTPVYNIASVQAVTITSGTGTALVKGTDFDHTVADLKEGVIHIIEGGTISAGSTSIWIDYTPAVYTGTPVLVPNRGPCTIQGQGKLTLNQCNGAKKAIWWVPNMSLVLPTLAFPVDKISETTIEATVLYDSTSNTPLGTWTEVG